MLKLGFIGFGNNGYLHAKSLVDNNKVELTAVVDPDEKQLELARQTAPGINCYKDYLEMFEKEKLDAVCISTPHNYHYEQVMKALDNNCHILLEKPIALEPQNCRKIIDTAEQKGLILQVGFECRKSALYVRVKEIIDSGEIGELSAISYIHYRAAWLKEWYCTEAFGGRSMAIIETCHYIDLMRFWSGDEVEWVFATTPRRNLRSEYEYPDTGFCHLGFKNGMVASIVDSHAPACDRFKESALDSSKSYATEEGEYMDPVYGHRFEYTIIGTEGSMIVNMFAKTISIMKEDFTSAEGRPQIGLKRVEDYGKQSLHDLVHDHSILDNMFIDCVVNNKPPVFSPEDAMKTHEVVFAIEESEKKCQKVML